VKDEIILPRKDSEGNYYISYSQYSSWKSASGFNTGFDGNIEYMLSYFFGMRFADAGWALFGEQVEGYVTERLYGEFFTQQEKDVMATITPLGVFQHEVRFFILPNVYILGFIDDATPDFSKIRDYKTASKSSKSRYFTPDYKQLDIYAMYVEEVTGNLPEAEVCIIERKGNVFGKVDARQLLSVGNFVEYVPRTITKERCDQVRLDLIKTVSEISDAYKLYLKLNGK
jgi:hypothetical protein